MFLFSSFLFCPLLFLLGLYLLSLQALLKFLLGLVLILLCMGLVIICMDFFMCGLFKALLASYGLFLFLLSPSLFLSSYSLTADETLPTAFWLLLWFQYYFSVFLSVHFPVSSSSRTQTIYYHLSACSPLLLSFFILCICPEYPRKMWILVQIKFRLHSTFLFSFNCSYIFFQLTVQLCYNDSVPLTVIYSISWCNFYFRIFKFVSAIWIWHLLGLGHPQNFCV